MKQTNDLMHHGLNGQPETITTVAHRTTRRLHQPLKTAILLLALVMGWGNSSVWADTEHDIWTGNAINTWVNLSSDKFNGCNVSTDVLRLYTTDGAISSFCTQWSQNVLNSGATTMPSGYYNLDLDCYQIPLTDFVSDFITKLATQGGLNIYVIDGHYLTRVSIATPATDPFINSTSPDAKGNGTKEVAEDTTHPTWESFSLSELTTNNTGATAFSALGDNIKYIRVYVKEGNNAVDYNSQVNGQTADLLQVTAGAGVTVAPAAAAGETADPKNGLNVYNGGTALTLNDITVTLNAGENHLKDYKIIVLLSTSALTNEGNEPTWDFEYTYTFTYPVEERIVYVPEDLNSSSELGNNYVALNYYTETLDFFGVPANNDNYARAGGMNGSWFARWYVRHKDGTLQSLGSGLSQSSSQWMGSMSFTNGDFEVQSGNGVHFSGTSVYNGSFSGGNNQQWAIAAMLGYFKVYRPTSVDSFSDYEVVFESTDECDSENPIIKLRYIFKFIPPVQFEYDGMIDPSTDITQTLDSRTSTSVTIDWTNSDKTTGAMTTTTGVKYARFFVVDSNGNPVDATDNAHKLTISGATATLCENHESGYYVYPGNEGNIDFNNLTVTLSSTSVPTGYQVKCWLATSETNIAHDGTTVTEEPDITNEYVYSFTKPAPTTVDKTGDIAWGASMQADATGGAPADWDVTWTELSKEQRVVWYVTDGTTKQPLALGTAAQANTWVLNLPTDKFSVSAANEAVLTGQTTFTATEWDTWGKPALYAPSGMAYADAHTYQVVCEVYETEAGTVPNVRYTFFFTKDFLGELKSGVTATTVPVVLTDASATSYELTGITLPTGAKYTRFYLTDGTGTPVDPTGKLTVSGTPGTVSGHADYGYYIYNESGITAPTVTLTLSDATLNQYRVVMVASADNAVTESGAVVNEPDWDTQTTWTFKYPVSHTEKTGTVEWSPVSMTVPLDIDDLKGDGYSATLTDYHVVWTVEDGSGNAQALTTGTERQAGTWTYSFSGTTATFYAPTGQTFADMGNVTFVARLYETATGENDADKSLTYTVSIVRTHFLGEAKDGAPAEVHYIVENIESGATSVEVPLNKATTAFSALGKTAKYARVWVTHNGTPIDPTTVFPLADATQFTQDATYGYYLHNSSAISLNAATLTASELNTYEVHIALSVDEPASTSSYARADAPFRAESLTEYEPDYDYLYTIGFSYTGGIVEHLYKTWNVGQITLDDVATLLQTHLPELTSSSTSGFIRWSILDASSNPILVKSDRYTTNGNNWSFTGSGTNIFGPYQQSDQTSFSISGNQISNYWNAFTKIIVYTPYGSTFADYPGYTVVCEVSDVNEPSDSQIKVRYIFHFNEDGNPPYALINVTDIAATKQMVNVSTLDNTTPLLDMSDALVDGAKYVRFYLTHYGMEADESSALNISYDGTAATACADPYGRYGYYLSSDDAFNLENLIVSTSLTPDQLMQYQLVVVSSTAPLSGDQEPAWEKKTVISFQKEIRERIYADDRNYLDAINKQADILSRLGATSVADFSKSLYARWYLVNPANEEQVIASGNGSYDYKWYFEIINSGIGNWQLVNDKQLVFYTDKDENCTSVKIAGDQWNTGAWDGQIGLTTKIHVSQTQNPPTATAMDYVGWKVIFEISDEYDTATNGATPDYRLRYVFTISDPNAFTGDANTGAAEEEVTQTVNRTAESIDLTLQDNSNWTTWAFEHQKLTQRQYQGQFPWGTWQTIETPIRYARFYLIDHEGNPVDPTGKLTVTYGGDNATVTLRETAPEQGFYVFGEGGTEIQRNQLTVSLAAPREYKLYKVVCLFSTALDGIEPADLTTPLQREPDYDLKYTYSFDYPTPTTKVINITIPWSKTGMTLRANTDADGDLLTSTSVDDAWGISFPELSAGQYVRWYVERQQGNNYTRQQLVSGSERTNGAWALNTASVYQFLDRTNQLGGDQAYLTGRTDFTDANWNNVWSSPTIYAPTGMNFNGPNGAQNCRFICEVYADDDDSGTPYVRYIFTMERFLGDLKDDGREGSETIIIPKETTSYDVPLDNIYSALNIPDNEKIVYARVWLTKADGTPVVPNGLTWTQMYNGSNQAQVLPGDREVYGWYFCSANIGQHTTGMDHGELASPPNSCVLSLPAGHYSQYQVHVALSRDNPSGMRWNNTTSRWEYANDIRPGETNTLPGQPAEPDFDYEYTIMFDYGFEAENINAVKTKYKTAFYNETTRTFTPTLFQNWLEVAADCDVQKNDLADKAYARWYLEDLEGNRIKIDELTSPQPYVSLGNDYGYYRYKFDVTRFNDTRGLTDNGYNPTIVLPAGYNYDEVRLVCVVTTKTEPQTGDPSVPYDIPAQEPQELQVKYVYSLVKESDLADRPFIHYQGEAYKYLMQMGRSDEAAERDYLIIDAETDAVEQSWDFENSKVSDQPFGNIRQNVHTVDYYVYFDPSDATNKDLMLPAQYYYGTGNDTEPRAYYRWYDFNTDKTAECLSIHGSALAETTDHRGYIAMLLNSTSDASPCDGNVGVRFNAPARWNADSEEILVACDVSRYLDGMDDSFTYLIHEPTLSVRYLFHILPAQQIANGIADAANDQTEGSATGLAAVEANLKADIDTELYEYNGRTVVSLNGTEGSFTLRSDLQRLSSYWIWSDDSKTQLVNCNNLQWYAYYLDADGKLWKHTVPMNGRETNRLATFTLEDMGGYYTEVGTENTIEKTIQPGDRLYMIGCMGNGYSEAPVVWNELNFIDAKPLLIGTEGTVEERTDQYMRTEHTLAQVLDFNDFFDEDERFKKPTASYENYAKVPIKWPNAQYGFCYPQLYGLCGTNKYAGWGVYGISPTHGDYTLLKSMNMPGVSQDEEFNQQSIGSQWWWTEQLYDVTHTRAANGNVATDANDYGTFLYVDASDEARVIAELEFDAALCADAEIYYTAYVADMTNNVTPPQVRFRVTTEVNGERVPVVTFETGNILTEGAVKGFWHQVYGHTTLPARLHHILNGTTRHYYVSVENSCENTNGADYCVDQISFYTHQASVKAKIVSDICDDGPVRVKIVAEAEQLLKSLKALSPTGADSKDVFFCIVERSADLNHELHAEDILTGLGYYTDQNNQPSNEYSVVSVPLNEDLLTDATELHDGIKDNTGFYYDATDGKVYFQLDEREFHLEPGKKYFVSIYDIAENRVGSLTGWGTPYSGNACTIYSNDVSPNRMYIDLSIDGQSTDGHIEFGCNATTVTKKYDIAINYPTGDGYDKYTFFNYDFFELADGKTKADFLAIKDETYDFYLIDAIETIRDWMGNDMKNRDIPESERDYAVPGNVYTELPQPAADDLEHMAMYNLITKYMGGGEDCPEGKLYLSATSSIERTFTEDGVYKYLAIPLTKEIPTGGEVCSPLEFAFDVDAAYGGPQIELGFDDVDYPDGYIRSVRVGLEQLNKMITKPTGGSNYMLHIPVSSYTNKGNGFGNRIYFQHTVLYLSKTNDPSIETNADGTPKSTNPIKVGEIKVPEHIGSGRAYVGPDRMFLPIDFSTCDITFHEGYYYEVGTTFVDEEDDQAADPCTGDLFFIIKVVPEFATWQSTEIMSHDTGVDTPTGFYNANWYNDQNWQRSVRGDLYKDAVGGQQNTVTLGHPTGYNNNGEGDLENLTSDVNPGFVPMKFTYVTILGGNHAPSLIKEPKVSTSSSQQGGGLLDPNLTRMLTDPSPYSNQLSSEPTENIRYDMLVRYGAHSEGGEGCFGHRMMSMNQAGKYIWGNDPRSEEQMTQFNTDRKAFDVEKFYGNICKEIYFKPGAELLRQQRLSYNRAWVEKEVNANKWYLVSSPLKDTYAGDMYVPTKMKNVATNEENVPGQQLTEAFQPINFNTAAVSSNDEHTITSQPAYSRTKYPIYQRSWNTDGSKVYTKTNDARATDYSANLVYPSVTTVATEWSHTYNDVQVPYTTLTGFSIRADRKQHVKTDGNNSVDVPALIRLPKADTQYDYYQWDNTSPADGKLTHSVARTTTPQTSYPLPSRYPAGITDNYRFVVDDPEADGILTVDISDLQQQDGYILVGNPHVASLRMDEFFRGNPGLVPSYWTYEGSVASAALATPTVITATGDGIIRPLQAFFVKKKTELDEGEDEATAIVFTRAMTIDGNYPAIPETSPSRQLTLSVADTEGASSAVVLLSDEADGDYREGEDVETLFDSNLADVPMVYTVADGGQAVSIDQRPQLDIVSFGVVQAKNELVEVKVTSHLSPLTSDLYFIDALTGEQTPVNDGTTLTVQPNDYGRYFLSTTAVQSSSAKEQSIIISVRQQEVTVTANGGQLSTVRATTLNGVAAYSSDAGLGTQCRFQLPKGVYIIQARTNDGIQRQLKVVVK